MSFDPKTLPPTVYDSYQKYGVAGWIVTVQFALREGIKETNTLVNIVFYLHHPELNGRQIYSDEIKLIAEWKAFCLMVGVLRKGMAQTTFAERETDPFIHEGISFNYSRLRSGRVSFNEVTLER
jgi:hypothetical protein